MGRSISLLVVCFFVSGCASTGAFGAAQLTSVELSSDNYRLVDVGASGEATAGYLLGASAPQAATVKTIGLVRLSGEEDLYEAALADLWANLEVEHGSPEGRALALTNVRYDSNALNLVVYTRPRVQIRADVIEFVRGSEE